MKGLETGGGFSLGQSSHISWLKDVVQLPKITTDIAKVRLLGDQGASDDVKQKSNVVKIAIFLFQSLTTAGTIWHIKKIGSIFYTSADGYLLIPCTNLCFDKILYGGKLRTINVVSLITYNELECKKRIPSSFLFPNTLARTDLL